jgi:uncharacterized protein YcbK (DUF882 family)
MSDERRVVITHFTNSELNCPCGCGATIEPDTLAALEAVRLDLNEPLHITSGRRCALHNQAVGGAENSRHVQPGDAVDIAVTESGKRARLIESALRHGFSGIGIDFKRGFVHIDQRPREYAAMWGY